MSRGRELGGALLACVAGAGVVLLAAGRGWVRATAVQGQLRAPFEVTGAALAPTVPALALAGLAGAAALVATRGAGRRLAGLLLLACGLGVAAAAVLGARLSDAELADRAGIALGAGTADAANRTTSPWPWAAAAGGALVAVAGAGALVRGPAWPGMGARYETPTPVVRAARREDTPIEQWRALDRGEDPTARD